RRAWSWRGHQPIADSAHGLHEQRIGGIELELAAQPIDLHIDGALAGRAAIAGQRQSRHGLAGRTREQPQHVALTVGEADDLLAAPQLAARDVEAELAETHGLDWRRRGGAGAAQYAGDAQRQLLGLERLADIVVGPDGEALDADRRLVARGQHGDWDARRRALLQG